MSMVANAKMLEIKSPGNWDASPVAQALIYNLIICLFILMLVFCHSKTPYYEC